MVDEIDKKKLRYCHEFEPTSGSLVLGLIIVSFGAFLIYWFYEKCRQLSCIENSTPEPRRAIAVLFMLPLLWFIIARIIQKLIFTGSFGYYLSVVGWLLILIFIIVFLYDFCLVFGKVTDHNPLYWFIILLFGIFGIVGLLFKNYYFSFLLIFLIFVVPSMQLELNSHFAKIMVKKGNHFYK